jgi:UDP-N-acetylglucosamine diphosphorylase/glucosamine-1-phosphate N-acetyltransferase
MNVILVDTDWSTFLPLTYTRPVSKLPLGAFTIAEKWERYFDLKVSYLTQSYLNGKFPTVLADENIYINSSVIPNRKVAEEIKALTTGKGIDFQGSWIAFCGSSIDEKEGVNFSEALSKTTFLRHWWNLFYHAETYIKSDFEDFFKGYPKEVSDTNLIIGDPLGLKVHPTAVVEGAILNTINGPIIIEEGAEVMEGSVLRGPVVVKPKAVIKMGAKIYGATIIGEGCKVGGEIKNSVFMSYANKAHDGYIGNAVVGAWVNMGAGTSLSNMKNTLGPIKVWSIAKEEYIPTHKQFLGGCIGDYSKFGIQTKLTTGSVVGIFANVLEEGFPPKFIPNFYWSNSKWYGTEKMEEMNERMHLLTDRPVSEHDAEIFRHLYRELNILA